MSRTFCSFMPIGLMALLLASAASPAGVATAADHPVAGPMPADHGAFQLSGVIEDLQKHRITVAGKTIHTQFAIWLNDAGRPVLRCSFRVGDHVTVEGRQRGNAYFARKIRKEADHSKVKVALLYVGHGEPAVVEDGDVAIIHADGTPFGPHAESLGTPPEVQYTEWAAAYEEIATAMSYIFGDLNGNGVLHEVSISPAGDVPPFFTWPAFHASIYEHYQACNNYSPHNDSIREHVESLNIQVEGADIDVHIAYLDAVPRIRDVVWELTQAGHYDELVVVPMLLAKSTHTQEVEDLVKEIVHLTSNMEVLITEPFQEVPFMQRRVKSAVLAMAQYVRASVPADVPDHQIGVLLTSHGTPYMPPYPEFGWQEGDIFSHLLQTEDAFHGQVGRSLPWKYRTGRMEWSDPTIAQSLAAFEAEGFTHILVVPSAFPTVAIHTMWDVANAAVGRAVMPHEGVVTNTRPSGMQVFYSAEGYADIPQGRTEFRAGLNFIGKLGVIEALTENDVEEPPPYVPYPPGELHVTVTSNQITGSTLQFLLYETTEADWPKAFQALPAPSWVVKVPPPMPERFPARIRVPLTNNLTAISGTTIEGKRLGLVIASSEGPVVAPTDARGFSASTVVHQADVGLNFGTINLAVPSVVEPCQPGEICVTVTVRATTGPDLKLMLYEAAAGDWPQNYRSLPTPSWVVTKTVPVPTNSTSLRIHIPLATNLFAISSRPLEGARLGLAIVTGVASTFIVNPDDARGFSANTLVYQQDAIMDYGAIEIDVPQGDPCDLNPYHPNCLTGPLFWQEHFLGAQNFVPGAIYLDVADLDGDGNQDIVMVGEPHFEEPNLPLTVLKLGAYYLNADFTVRETEIIDAWSEADPMFYSPWGVNVIDHGGAAMILVGLNIPGLAPLEEGTGAVLSYHREGGTWVRSVVMANPNPTETNYNAMIVVTSDLDKDGDEDLALSGAFGSSAVGSWMENTGQPATPWIPHLQTMIPGSQPGIRGALAYKSADLNGDGYPEVVYNGMFDIPGTMPPRYRGEIWLGVNPGPQGWNGPWQKIVIDDDNWASADMWFHDFNGDGYLDLVANQIFSSTVTVYRHPGANLSDPWVPEVIISGLTSPSDMWLADMDGDGLTDVVSADHTAHRGVWHKNPGPGSQKTWLPNLIYRDIRLPGDFVMTDIDKDGDLDWVGTSLTLGQAFVAEQLQPAAGLVATISLPDNFSGQMTKLLVTLANSVPVTGMPAAILATIDNADKDGDGVGDLDQILSPSRDLVLALPDVGVNGDYHVVVALYMQGGGQFQPVPGIDYMANSQKIPLGQGKAQVSLDLNLLPAFGAAPELPELSVESTPNNTLLISWPATTTGFQLQQASHAGSPTWSNVSVPAKLVGNRYQVTIDGPAGGRFYRLLRP